MSEPLTEFDLLPGWFAGVWVERDGTVLPTFKPLTCICPHRYDFCLHDNSHPGCFWMSGGADGC
jgi:hypothetical protein